MYSNSNLLSASFLNTLFRQAPNAAFPNTPTCKATAAFPLFYNLPPYGSIGAIFRGDEYTDFSTKVPTFKIS